MHPDVKKYGWVLLKVIAVVVIATVLIILDPAEHRQHPPTEKERCLLRGWHVLEAHHTIGDLDSPLNTWVCVPKLPMLFRKGSPP